MFSTKPCAYAGYLHSAHEKQQPLYPCTPLNLDISRARPLALPFCLGLCIWIKPLAR